MTTEAKIREAFEKWKDDYALAYEPNYSKATEEDCRAAYKAGHMALLNELVPQGEWNTFPNGLDGECRRTTIYTLPEGVEK